MLGKPPALVETDPPDVTSAFPKVGGGSVRGERVGGTQGPLVRQVIVSRAVSFAPYKTVANLHLSFHLHKTFCDRFNFYVIISSSHWYFTLSSSELLIK